MKKVALLVCLVLLVTLFGCDLYGGERPEDYVNTIWRAQGYDIWFIVSEANTNAYEPKKPPEGQIVYNGNTYDIKVWFDYGASAYFYNHENDNEDYFSGKCEFHPYEFTVYIYKDRENIFDSKVDKIVFKREDVKPTDNKTAS